MRQEPVTKVSNVCVKQVAIGRTTHLVRVSWKRRNGVQLILTIDRHHQFLLAFNPHRLLHFLRPLEKAIILSIKHSEAEPAFRFPSASARHAFEMAYTMDDDSGLFDPTPKPVFDPTSYCVEHEPGRKLL